MNQIKKTKNDDDDDEEEDDDSFKLGSAQPDVPLESSRYSSAGNRFHRLACTQSRRRLTLHWR